MSGPPSGRPRSSRLALGLSVAALLAVVAGFSWIAVKSYDVINSSKAPLGRANLKRVDLAGPEETVFDWSRQACEPRDIPDEPARAYRDAQGEVHLFASSYVSRALVGPDLKRVRRDCRVVMRSALNARPQLFTDREWIASPYTFDGRTVYALLHDEYHGFQHAAGHCLTPFPNCWYNAVTLALSRDEGRTFYPAAPPPASLVAELPYRYRPDLPPYGVFNPSNIVKKGDYYYSMVVVQRYQAQRAGTCVTRTRNLGDPRSWRAWDGDGYGVSFVDPYQSTASATANHLCEPVSPNQIGTMSSSLTFSTYFGKYLLLGSSSTYDPRKRRTVAGFYYSVSDDLLHWSQRALIREAELPWTYQCGDADPVLYPSVVDPASTSRNFETTGRRPYLYFTREHYSACRETLDRDLVRVPIEFSK
jgi:hypothetical protein